jgi:hypothetical protein
VIDKFGAGQASAHTGSALSGELIFQTAAKRQERRSPSTKARHYIGRRIAGIDLHADELFR